ncbi:hypothetical protein MMC12_008434 [Toensbergia leucococca]|nr:hypothetical protein [Toensbergia leucococca]
MRLRHRPSPLFLLLIPSFSSTFAIKSPDQVEALAEGKQLGRYGQILEPTPSLASTIPKANPNSAYGKTKDAPVDGKDGRPHEGPFIETAAERDRKKAKESGEEEAVTPGKKPQPKDQGKGASYTDGWKMPESNDGVMDDPNRPGPKEGTRGTEGGISEKNKAQDGQLGSKSEKKPDSPKEAPPLPHSEQEKLGQSDGKDSSKKSSEGNAEESEKPKELGGLEKPADLPEKPHDIPHPVPNTPPREDPLKISKPFIPTILLPPSPAALIQPLHSFVLSLTMIIFSEIGDKTFLIAALMAMKHPRLLVFSAAFSALIAMTILSAVLGHAVPTLIPKRYTNFLAATLFLIFGAKMLREGYTIDPNEGVGAEMKEVEMELEEKKQIARRLGRRRSSVTPYMLEAGRVNTRKSRSNSRLPAPDSPSSSGSRSPSPSRASSFTNAMAGINNLCSLLLSPAWVQTFIMTFLGEWGDRSQIATIAMAAGQDYWWVTGGAVTGHALCTAGAVIGGRAIAGRVSLRVVTLGGGFAFLVFGFIYLGEAYYT